MERSVKLVAPNGVEVEAREDAVEHLLQNGWKYADKPRAARKRTTTRNKRN